MSKLKCDILSYFQTMCSMEKRRKKSRQKKPSKSPLNPKSMSCQWTLRMGIFFSPSVTAFCVRTILVYYICWCVPYIERSASIRERETVIKEAASYWAAFYGVATARVEKGCSAVQPTVALVCLYRGSRPPPPVKLKYSKLPEGRRASCCDQGVKVDTGIALQRNDGPA